MFAWTRKDGCKFVWKKMWAESVWGLPMDLVSVLENHKFWVKEEEEEYFHSSSTVRKNVGSNAVRHLQAPKLKQEEWVSYIWHHICCTMMMMIVVECEHFLYAFWVFGSHSACMYGRSQPTMNIFSKGSRLKNHYRYSPQQIRNNFGACVSEKMLGCLAKVTHPFAGGITLPKFISMPTNEKERWCVSAEQCKPSISRPYSLHYCCRLACLLSVWIRAYFFFLYSAYVQHGKLYACMHKNIPLGFPFGTDGVTLLRERNNIYNIRAFSASWSTHSHTQSKAH